MFSDPEKFENHKLMQILQKLSKKRPNLLVINNFYIKNNRVFGLNIQ